MKQIVTLFLTIIGVLIIDQGFTQEVDPEFVDGKLYVKVRQKIPQGLPYIDAQRDIDQLDQEIFPDLYQLSKTYGFQLLRHAFKTSSPELDYTYVIAFSQKNQVQQLKRSLEKLTYVEYVEQVPLDRSYYLPNDWSDFDDLYHLEITGAQEAWDITRGSEDVVIAIVDDAVFVNHEDLRDNIWVNPGEIPGNGADDDNNGYIDDVNGFDVTSDNPNPNPPREEFSHGTHVAGCASAATDNEIGIPAMGFNCKIMGIRASSNANSDNISDGYAGVDYAIRAGATIINMSWGGGNASQVHQNLMNAAHNRGIILVAAAGNDNSDGIQYPAGYNHVISVGATTSSDRRAGFSNFGFVDIMAPGDNILSTITGGTTGKYGTNDGTSFAAPIVAGLLGLMKSVNPCLSPNEAERILDETAVNIDDVNPDFAGRLGAGRIDAAAAVLAASLAEGSGTPPPPVANFSFDNTSTCSNKIPFTFEAEPGTGSCAFSINYRWSISNDNGFEYVTNEKDPLIEFPESGEYSVSLRVSNTGGTDEMVEMVNVQVNPNAFINAGEGQIVCQGDSVVLNGSTTADIQSISWEPIVGLSNPESLTPTFRALRAGGTYTLTIEGGDGCTLVDSVQIDVFRNPFVRTLPDQDTVIQPDDTLQLNIAEGSGAFTFIWSPSIGLSDTTIANPLAYPDTTTRYTVVGTGGGGCTSTSEVLITVDENVSNQPFLSRNLSIYPVYPNPVEALFYLSADFQVPDHMDISLKSIQGKLIEKIYSGKVGQGRFEYVWSRDTKLAPGLYFIHWEGNGIQHTQKVFLR